MNRKGTDQRTFVQVSVEDLRTLFLCNQCWQPGDVIEARTQSKFQE